MSWFSERLRERSTWAGLAGGVLAIAGMTGADWAADPERAQQINQGITVAGLSLASLVNVFTKAQR
jgi:hypothetical protein